MHNGVMHKSGDEITEGDAGFKDLVQAGHATEMVFKDVGPVAAPEVMEAEEGDEDMGAKRRGRK